MLARVSSHLPYRPTISIVLLCQELLHGFRCETLVPTFYFRPSFMSFFLSCRNAEPRIRNVSSYGLLLQTSLLFRTLFKVLRFSRQRRFGNYHFFLQSGVGEEHSPQIRFSEPLSLSSFSEPKMFVRLVARRRYSAQVLFETCFGKASEYQAKRLLSRLHSICKLHT